MTCFVLDPSINAFDNFLRRIVSGKVFNSTRTAMFITRIFVFVGLIPFLYMTFCFSPLPDIMGFADRIFVYAKRGAPS